MLIIMLKTDDGITAWGANDHQFSESKKIKSTINSVLLGYSQSVGAHWGGH